VAVIDSGVDADHPAVGTVSGYVSVDVRGNEIRLDEAPHRDGYGHGTACAGIIRSLAPACEIYSVRVLGPVLTGSGAAFAAGLRWAIEQGIRVCNLSLGTSKPAFHGVLHDLADSAYFRNLILVSAANNLPVASFPANFASVISVAAHDGDKELYYYNPKPPAEFAAPGIDVRVPWANGEWITATGNSFAAPYITGLVARLLGEHPELTPFQVKTVLRALAANVAGPRESTSAS
jgi:subtilisin family serine protease